MNPLVLQCPICTNPFQVLPEQAGQVVQCPGCEQQVSIPADIVPTTAAKSSPAPEPPRTPGTRLFACPACQGQFGVTENMLGQQVGCPHCRTTVQIGPESGGSSPPNEVEQSEQDLFAPGYHPDPSLPGDPGVSPLITSGRKRRPGSKVPRVSLPRPSSASSAGPRNSTAVPEPKAGGSAGKSTSLAGSGKKGKSQPRDHEESPKAPASLQVEVNPAKADISDVGQSRSELLESNDGDSVEVASLLPPRFDVYDPDFVHHKSLAGHKVYLPDGRGGMQQVDDRILRVEHEGRNVHLVAMSDEQRERRRLIRNSVMIFVGILILIIAFLLLPKSY